jgi:LacI family transcriptional regulator
LGAEKTPVVLLDRLFRDAPVDQVGADNRESMRHLVRHLVAQGHRRFVVVAGDTRVPTLGERLEGFYDGLRDEGVDVADQLVLTGANGEDDAQRVAAALADATPTAMIACSTPLAAAGLRALSDSGREIPRDIAFATFDGFDNPDLFRPRITTVQQPTFDMGFAAVALLMERLESPLARPRTVRLHQELILRESTEGFRPSGS